MSAAVRRSTRSDHRAVALGAAAILAAALAVSFPPAAQARSPAVLRLLWWTDVGFPTPFAFSTVGPGGVVRLSLLYDTLTWKDPQGVIPWLAQSWRIAPDGRRITFALRPDVLWHDGRPLTARDVQFTFEYYRVHPFAWMDTRIVERALAEGLHTVTVVLREPFAPFLEQVAGTVPIIPAHVWQGIDEPRRAQTPAVAVGSGPYRLAEYRPAAGDYRFVANPRYFRGRPRFDEIRYSVLPAERQILAVQSGQADVAMADTYDVVRAFADHPYLRVWATEPLSVARLLFNLERPPLDWKPVRQAIAYATNRMQLATLVTRGPGLPGSPGVIPPGDPWAAPNLRAYPFDPARARTLLAQAGLAAPSVEIVTSPSPVAPLLQRMLREVGIEVTLRTVDAQTRAALIAEARFQAALTFHIGAGGDPDYLRRWFVGDEANLFGQSRAFSHPEFQALAAAQVGMLDVGARRRVVAAMQAILAEELPTLVLYYRRFYWVYDSRKFTPVPARGGLMNGIPLVENKLALITPSDFLPMR
ncbi:MAG: ABC transporter substrate-binding protein [Armatimonadota bacterium]|nr:ABC transporter substrate-binding protein [Armatimonadota bacterium]